MNKSTIFRKIAQKVLATIAPKAGKVITPLIPKVSAALGVIELSQLADSTIGAIPGIRKIAGGIQAVNDAVYEKTIGKIPGVGNLLVNLTNAGQELMYPKIKDQARKIRGNDPEWYTNVDMHTAFQLPFGYPDNLKLPFGDGVDRASVAILSTYFNPLSDGDQTGVRMTQVLDLLKAVRGLSGSLPYDAVDLSRYMNIGYLLLNNYYTLKFCLKVANNYSLIKSRFPRVFLQQVGFNPDDFIANRPLYVGLLTNIANFITNNYPIFSTMCEKIQFMVSGFIPDSDDYTNALFYYFKNRIAAVFPRAADYVYGLHFARLSISENGENAYSYPSNSDVTYNAYEGDFQVFLQDYLTVSVMSTIKADIIGAFGQSAIWSDKYINEVQNVDPGTSNYSKLIYPYNELVLTQIQNATVLMMDSSMVVTSSGTRSLPVEHRIVTTQPHNYTTFQSCYLSDVAIYQTPSTDSVQYATPATDGFLGCGYTENKPSDYRFTDSTFINTYKKDMSEGELLEITQLVSWCIDISNSARENLQTVVSKYETHDFALGDIQYVYYDGADKVVDGRNVTVMVGAVSSGFQATQLNQLLLQNQFWSQADWAPTTSVELVNTDTNQISNFVNMDLNIVGTLSRAANALSISYSRYSLLAPRVKVTEKRIDNIVNAYNIKA